jgi:hypothetical protein
MEWIDLSPGAAAPFDVVELEEFEAIAQDAGSRALFRQLAALVRSNEIDQFLDSTFANPNIDFLTKSALADLARDEQLLFAFEHYAQRTAVLH